jgi:ribosomal-protein-alanine N-acetyltransferase
MIVRKAEPRDLSSIAEIESLCFPADTAFPYRMFAYLLDYSIALVACERSRVVGFVMGYISGRGGAIYTLDVHPFFRRHGIGSMLLRSIEEELSFRGAKAVRLEAAIENPAALGLYRKAGYREREIVRNYYGQKKDAVRMWKTLNGN